MRKSKYILIVILILFSFTGGAEASSAPPPSIPFEESEQIVTIPDVCDHPSILRPNRMSGNIVRCVEHIIAVRANEMIRGLVSDFSFIVFHVIIIGIILFFIRVMFGVARARGVISMFALKVIVVLMVANPNNVDTLIAWKDALIAFPQDISLRILQAVESPISGALIDNDDVFDTLDVYVLNMFGVDPSTLSPDPEKQVEFYFGIAAMIAGMFFTGPMGAAVSAVTIGFVIAVISAVAQAVMFFCTIIIALNFLAAMAPIAVTCLLFQPTKKITNQWFQYCLIYVIQPLLLMSVLGLTMGILNNVIDSFNEPHSKIQAKWENKDGDDVKEVKLFDCSNMSLSAGDFLNFYGKSDFMGNIVSQSYMSGQDYNRYTMGAADMGSETRFSADDLNLDFGSNCEIKVPSLKIDFNQEEFDDESNTNTFDEEDARELMGLELAVTILLIMLISFLVKLPQMVNMMVGQGVIADLTNYAAAPVKKTEEILYGSRDGTNKSSVQNWVESVKSKPADTNRRGFKA